MSPRQLPPFTTPVRGHAYAPPPPSGASHLRPGMAAVLAREPDNPRDHRAIAVWVQVPGGWWRIGYLERAVAARLAPRMDDGEEVRATTRGWVSEPLGRWVRPVVLVSPAEQGLHGHQAARGQHALDDGVVHAA